MDEAKRHSTVARRRGRPFKVPYIERVRWVGFADDAKRVALLYARMQQLQAADQAGFDTLPLGLQVLVSGAWGRHSRYLDAVGLKSAVAPPLDDRIHRLVPKESDPSKWTVREKKRAALVKQALRQYQLEHFGKDVTLGVIHVDQPSYVARVAGAIDRWCADRLEVSRSAFRSWRRRLVAEPDVEEKRLLVRRKRKSKARRRSGRQLKTRLAQHSKAAKRP